MHRTIGYLSKRLVQIRPGEGRKVLLTFLYFFLVITAYYVIKPVSRSLVLGELGSRVVPWADLISTLLMWPLVALFAHLVDRFDKPRLVNVTFWAVTAILLLFWELLRAPGRWLPAWTSQWVPAAFYVWVAVFSVLVVTLFWLVANDLYRPREAKRLFGFIGSGGILGGVVGSSIAAVGAKLVGTERLLLCSAAVLVACCLVVNRLWSYASGPLHAESARYTSGRSSPASNRTSLGRLVLGSRYLLLLVGLVGIAKVVSTFVYYQFNPFIEQTFPDANAKTAFLGLFFGWMNAASFVVQFFFTSWILRRLGLGVALFLLPIGVLSGSIGLLVAPIFWIAAATELYDGSLNYSLQQTTKEVLYLPIDRSIRYKVKPFIDMIVFRFGKGIAAVTGIVLLDVLHLEARVLAYLTVPLVAVWVALALQLRRDYVKTIRDILQARAASRRSDMDAILTRSSAQDLGGDAEDLDEQLALMGLGNPAHRKLILASQLFAGTRAVGAEREQLLHALAEYEQRPHAIERQALVRSVDALKECLQDRHEPMAIRRYAVKQLVQRDGQEAVDCLLGMLMVEEDAVMRRELIRGLAKLRIRHPHLEFPKRLIRRQVAKEVQVCQRIVQIAAIYRGAVGPGVPWEDDTLLELLGALMEENSQQIFRLLSLVYRPKDICLIYNQLREPDAYVRADAIELLDNLIDPSFRWLIFPILDENRFLERMNGQADDPVPTGKDAQAVLRDGIWDHNRWLSVTTLFLVGRLRIEPLLPELERMAQSQTTVLALAARAAQHLAGSAPVS